ncbi:MAG: TonB-dependent receptor [Pseudomonas sp.]
MNRKRNVLAAAMLLSLQWPALSAAQDASATSGGQSDTDTAKPATTRTLDQVTVTAERRVQDVQKTPVAVSSVEGEQIHERGLKDIGDVLSQSPAVQVQNSSKGAAVFIRGVGSTGDAQEGGDPAVNLSIDGVYQQQAAVALANTLDLERVEVLRGPQGTLYGRNANAGSINVITRDPVLGEFSGSSLVDVGNYNSVRTETAINLPVSDVLAARVAYGTSKHDGYLSNGASADDSTAARLKLLYQPNEDLKVRFTVDHSRQTGTPVATVELPLSHSDPWHSDLTAGVQDVKLTRVYAQLDYNLGFATLSVLPAYSYTHQYSDSLLLEAGGASAVDVTERARSGEVRLVSNDSPVQWVTGLYYYNSDNYINPNPKITINATHNEVTTFPSDVLEHSLSKSYAAYGQATIPLSDRFRVIGGARYTRDWKGFDLLSETASYVFEPEGRYTHAWNSGTFRAGAEYDLAEHSFLYGTISNGVKSGGLNVSDLSTYEPEKITSYEIGSKNRFLDNRLQVNASLFYYDYSNYQARLPYPDSTASGGFSQKIQNAKSAYLSGAELEVDIAPTTRDRIDLSVAYLHARFGTFTYTDSSGYVDRSGTTPPNAPTWSGLASYSHYWDMASGASLQARLDLRFSSHYDSTIDEGLDDIQPAFTRSDASLIWTSSSGRWGWRVYVRNIENKAQRLFTIAPSSSLSVVEVSDPRTFGTSVNFNF